MAIDSRPEITKSRLWLYHLSSATIEAGVRTTSAVKPLIVLSDIRDAILPGSVRQSRRDQRGSDVRLAERTGLAARLEHPGRGLYVVSPGCSEPPTLAGRPVDVVHSGRSANPGLTTIVRSAARRTHSPAGIARASSAPSDPSPKPRRPQRRHRWRHGRG